MRVKKLLSAAVALTILSGTCTVNATETSDMDTWICDEYKQYIYEISDEYHVCPELIMAITEKESSGKANAKNGNCKGLMQVYDKWHSDRMKRLGVTDIYNPKQNILIGTDYIAELAAEYEDIYTALMIYNGTSNAVEKAEMGQYSDYAIEIVKRSEQLERVHGK